MKMELTPVQKVFSLPELVTLILEYSASGQKRNDILRLRTVCHLWRRMAFNTLLSNKIVAKFSWERKQNTGFSNAHNQFPPDCHFPMELIPTAWKLKLNDLKFIHSHAHNFVTMKIINAEVRSTTLYLTSSKFTLKHAPLLDMLTVKLPKLKLLDVRIPKNIQFSIKHDPLHQLIVNIAENSSRLETFNLEVCLQAGDTLPRTILRKVTSLCVTFAVYSTLEQVLLESELPKLTSLQLSTTLQTDSEIIQSIATKFCGQLSFFNFPAINTQYLYIFLGNKGEFEFLEKLELTGSLDVSAEIVVKLISRIESQIPALKDFRLPVMTAQLAEKVLPQIFSRMTRLTALSISITNAFVHGGDYEIGKMLTGVDFNHGFRPEEVDDNSSLWRSLLVGKSRSITNLKNLKEFKLEVGLRKNRVVCRIPSFLFLAGFFQMPHLATVTLINCKINQGLIENYREKTGRSLIIRNTRTLPTTWRLLPGGLAVSMYSIGSDSESSMHSDSDEEAAEM